MNSGDRLLRIYDALMGLPENTQMMHAWAKALDVDPGTPDLEEEISLLVLGVRREVDVARRRLDLIGVPAGLSEPAFNRLRQVASPTQLNVPWGSHRGNVQPPECRKILEWVSWTLKEEAEGEMEPAMLEALREELDALQTALGTTDVSPHLRDFIESQIAAIRGALRMYRVQGAKPIQAALTKVVGEFKVNEKALQQDLQTAPEEAKGIVARAAAMVEKVAKVADNLSKLKKGVEDVYSIGSTVTATVGPLIHLLSK